MPSTPKSKESNADVEVENKGLFERLPLVLRVPIKVVLVTLLFIALVSGVRWTCCISFSLFRFGFQLYENVLAEVIAGNQKINIEQLLVEFVAWWEGVRQCAARY